MSFRTSYFLAAAITVGIAGWMATGTTIIAGTPPEEAPPTDLSTGARVVAKLRQSLGLAPEPAETELAAADPAASAPVAAATAAEAEPPFRVRVATLKAAERQAVLTVRGRTEADAKVQVRAETGGILQTRHVRQGDRVKVGDPLCTLDRGTREARLAQARAALAQAEFDLGGAAKLAGRGFTPEARVKALKATVDAARASVAEAELDLARTEVKSPLDAIVGEPLAEIGDLVSPGGLCVTLIDSDPILFTGQVSERDIGTLTVGMTATAHLVTGEELTGRLRYIAPAADPQTRTFRIEIETANPDGAIRDGVTALAAIPLAPVKGHRLSPAVLTLNDEGLIGVRSVDNAGTVTFLPVKILADTEEGVWVAGLPDEATVIVVGQDYVKAGAKVEAVRADAETTDGAPAR